jgi:DNA recombination protein RmuC
MVILAVIVGFALGALAAWLLARTRSTILESELARERERGAERLAAAEEARATLETTFKALSAEALRTNNESFLQLARGQLEQRQQAVEHLVKPIRETLERVGNEVKTLEQSRRQDYGSLTAQVRTLGETNERLRAETGNLVTALRAPGVRGRWGEMSLRKAVEQAGMLEYCDFVEQVVVSDGERTLRPDLVVRLPGGRNVVVDAKAPLTAILEAHAATDDEARARHLVDFARHVREHVTKLSARGYWTQFSPTPDFVVMFLPGEGFYRAAVEQDAALLDLTVRKRVMLASPSTLITLLQAIAVGWREERVAESARAVNELGRELYERLAVLSEHFVTLGRRLNSTVQIYNQAVGSFERRVLVSARRFTEHGVPAGKELLSPDAVETSAQPPQTVELGPRATSGELQLPGVGEADAA